MENRTTTECKATFIRKDGWEKKIVVSMYVACNKHQRPRFFFDREIRIPFHLDEFKPFNMADSLEDVSVHVGVFLLDTKLAYELQYLAQGLGVKDIPLEVVYREL